MQHHFGRVEVCQQLVYVFNVAFCNIEFTGRHIKEADAVYLVGQMQSAEEVVFLDVEHHVVVCNARCDKFCDTSLYQTFGCLWIFKLFADGHSQAGPDQAGEILLNGVMGNTGKITVCTVSGGFARERYTKDIRCFMCIFSKSLIEVTDSEQ